MADNNNNGLPELGTIFPESTSEESKKRCKIVTGVSLGIVGVYALFMAFFVL